MISLFYLLHFLLLSMKCVPAARSSAGVQRMKSYLAVLGKEYTSAIWRSNLHGVGRHMHAAVPSLPTGVAKRDPLLVAGKLNELAEFILQ